MQYRTMTVFTALATLAALGCGGEKKVSTDSSTVTTPPAAPPAAAPTGDVVTVNMTGDGTTKAKFEPDHITIAPGSTVRFVNVSGGPHNVSFWPDSIPSGAADALRSHMPNGAGDLQSELLTQPSQNLDLSFAGAPVGEYKAYCLPHMALTMRIWITVK